MKLAVLVIFALTLAPRGFCQNSTEGVQEEVDEEEDYFEDGISYNATDILAGNDTEIDVGDNSTDMSAANATLAPNATSISTSTKSANATLSTTPKPTTTTPAPINFPESAVGQVVCTCDLKVNECDIGCCCDPDCSKFDRTAFPQCQKIEHSQDGCNTNGFLCLFKDNTPERLWLTNPKLANTLKDFDTAAQRSPKWNWPDRELSSKAKFHPRSKYKSGDVIWATQDNITIAPFALPILGKRCTKNATVLYLHGASATCSPSADNPIGKGDLVFKDLWLLSDTSLPIANQSEPWVKVKTLYCRDNASLENCTESINSTKQRTAKLQFQIFHNGTQGILSAKVYIWLTSTEISQRPDRMKISVIFLWGDEQPPNISRSGSPGYLQRLPILTGLLSDNKTTVSSKGFFYLASSDNNGACARHRKILFGEDLLVTCDLELNVTGCVASEIMSTLAGRLSNSVAGAFGDSEEGTLKDWLPILVKEQPPNPVVACARAPTSLSVQILWAKVGSMETPQNKLTGMMVTFGGSKTISEPAVRLTTSVTFKEVTTGLKGLFAPPPKYEIRLPKDFFYPLYNSACHLSVQFYFKLLMIASCVTLQ